MKTLVGLSILTQIAWVTPTPAADAGRTREETCQSKPYVSVILDGRIIEIDVSPEQIEQSPAWDRDAGTEPPLSVGQALRLATPEFLLTVPDPERWRLGDVILVPLCFGRSIYTVNWFRQGPGKQGNVSVPVLMSGVVLSTSRAVAAAKKSDE